MAKPFELQSTRMVMRTAIFGLREDVARHPDSGEDGRYYVLEAPDWVQIVAVTETQELVLVRQWRHGSRLVELEVPGGLVDPGEDALQAAARELREETGYVAQRLEVLDVMRPNPAFLSNTVTTVLATGCRREGAPEPDHDEDIEVIVATRAQVVSWVDDRTIGHGVALCALYTWLRGTPEGATGRAEQA